MRNGGRVLQRGGGKVRTASEGEKRETVERDGGEEKREGKGKVTGG